MRISIHLDISSRSFIPLPRFIRWCRPTPFLAPSLVLTSTFSSVFCLSGTCWVFILAFHWLFVLIIGLVWHLPSLGPHIFKFILMKINTQGGERKRTNFPWLSPFFIRMKLNTERQTWNLSPLNIVSIQVFRCPRWSPVPRGPSTRSPLVERNFIMNNRQRES